MDLADRRVAAVLHVLGIDDGLARWAFARENGCPLRSPGLTRVRRLVVMALRLARFGGVGLSYPEISALCGLSTSGVQEIVKGRGGAA